MVEFYILNGVLRSYNGNGGNVIIPDGVTSIGDYAFEGCESLASITIPDGVTSIGDFAFIGCESLASITIPDGVTSIGYRAFHECKSLTSITIPDGVTSIGNDAFFGCKSLTSITIPDGVTSIAGRAFYGCESLTSITIPDGVTSIGYRAFHECKSLTSITIPDSVTSIGNYAFDGCESLTSITIPDGVTSIGYDAFYGCKSLMSITIPDSVTSISNGAFRGCSSLSITIPEKFAKRFNTIFHDLEISAIHISDISDVSSKYRPMCAVGFAEGNRDITDESGKKYAKYIKTNAVKLIDMAMKHPKLFYLMINEKLIAAKDLDAVTEAVQKSGNAEYVAAILEYGNSAISEKEKAKVAAKKEERDENVTNFFFDAEKLEKLRGKKFVITGKLKTFVSRDEFRECIENGGATLTEKIERGVDYLITNTPNSGTAKNKQAIEFGIKRITEDEFNEMIGRSVEK